MLMTLLLGVICLVAAVGFATQAVSAVDFARAQRLGFQEMPDNVDPLYGRLEHNTARWDLLTLWTLPLAGLLILLGLAWWPYLGLIGGGVYLDAGGREAAKVLALRAEGVRTGTALDQRLAIAVFGYMILAGLVMIVASLAALA
jgi:hypothetical protein